VANIGVGHGRKWRFERGGEWLLAFSEYVGEAGNVSKVWWTQANFFLPLFYEYGKLACNRCSLIWEVPIHVATSYVSSRPDWHKADNEFSFS